MTLLRMAPLVLLLAGCARGHRVSCSRTYTGTYDHGVDQNNCTSGANCNPLCVIVPTVVTTTVTATGCVPHDVSESDAIFRCDQALQDQYDRAAPGASFTAAQSQALRQANLLNASSSCPQPPNQWPDWNFTHMGSWMVNGCASDDPGPWWH